MNTPSSVDLLVYGATPGGIACAVRSAREGLRVLLVTHSHHPGGFITSGAGGWETPCDLPRSPIYAEVRRNISEYYRQTYGDGSPQHLASMPQADSRRHIDRAKVEPRVAEMVFDEIIKSEPNITLWYGWYPASVKRAGVTLSSVILHRMEGNGRCEISASTFVDASYEGDLAAVAGVPYRVGREARTEYAEPHAGRVFTQHRPAPTGKPGWPRASAEGTLNMRTFGHSSGAIVLHESTGEADAAIMAYNYRLILTSDPANRIEPPKPANYDPSRFRGMGWHSIVPNLPNQKIAWNAGRLIGPQHAYPEGDWNTRKRIDQEYRDAILGLLYYLQHDPEVPAQTREFWRPYGLALDEFPDNDHLPYEVYVREARRIVGRYVFTEHDGLPVADQARPPIHGDSVATTDWPLDSVACNDITVGDSGMDGVFFLAEESRPAQVPWRCLLTQGLDNLLVPVCLSASHVGWGAIRLEPVWMQTGEAAGFATALALQQGIAPAALDPTQLVRTLVEHRCMVAFFNDVDVASDEPWVPSVQYLATLGFFDSYDARPHELLGAAAGDWTERWLNLSSSATRLDSALSRADAAVKIYRNLTHTRAQGSI